jgi:DNA end-binding protein Ku
MSIMKREGSSTAITGSNEVAKGDYVIVSDEELAAIEIESTHTIEIEKFVARSEVDPVYL